MPERAPNDDKPARGTECERIEEQSSVGRRSISRSAALLAKTKDEHAKGSDPANGIVGHSFSDGGSKVSEAGCSKRRGKRSELTDECQEMAKASDEYVDCR